MSCFGYKILEERSSGSYGSVYVVEKKGKKYAMKKYIERDSDRDIGIPPQIVRELSILSSINHPNVIRPVEISVTKEKKRHCNFCCILDLALMDLDDYIKKGFINTPNKKHLICSQLACGIKVLHDNNLIHSDIKPANCLVMKDSTVKISDLDCIYAPFGRSLLIRKKTTKHYRAPELLIFEQGKKFYTKSIDIWSLGCVFFEVLSGKRLITIHGPTLTPIREEKELIRLQSGMIPKRYVNLLTSMLSMNPATRIDIDKVLSELSKIQKSFVCKSIEQVQFGPIVANQNIKKDLLDTIYMLSKKGIKYLGEEREELSYSLYITSLDIANHFYTKKSENSDKNYTLAFVLLASKLLEAYWYMDKIVKGENLKSVFIAECDIVKTLNFELFRKINPKKSVSRKTFVEDRYFL